MRERFINYQLMLELVTQYKIIFYHYKLLLLITRFLYIVNLSYCVICMRSRMFVYLEAPFTYSYILYNSNI